MGGIADDLRHGGYEDPDFRFNPAGIELRHATGIETLYEVLCNRRQKALLSQPGGVAVFAHDLHQLEQALEKAKQAIGRRKAPNRKRSRKAEVILKVHAAILYKIDNPGATPQQCADEGALPRTTLIDNVLWIEWFPKIDKAARDGRLRQVRAEWDQRTGQFLATAVPGEAED
jgi:hypothetical protein